MNQSFKNVYTHSNDNKCKPASSADSQLPKGFQRLLTKMFNSAKAVKYKQMINIIFFLIIFAQTSIITAQSVGVWSSYADMKMEIIV